MERFKIFPKPGLVIRDPLDMTIISTDGKIVLKTPFWMRRIKDGDVSLEPFQKEEVEFDNHDDEEQ